jgi:DNA-binding transcriptional MerR regulator
MMTIAEVGKKYDLSADTLRYYERIGLLPSVNRNSSGNRDYTEEDCRWVKFIKCMRSAGLSIEILIEYVSLFQQGSSTIGARKELLVEQRKQIAEKINELQTTLSYLDKKIVGYEEHMTPLEDQLKKFDE